jgi:hypothetical protein
MRQTGRATYTRLVAFQIARPIEHLSVRTGSISADAFTNVEKLL